MLSFKVVTSDETVMIGENDETSQQSGFLFVGAGVGGGVLIVVIFIVIILVCMCWKRSLKVKQRYDYLNDFYYFSTRPSQQLAL